MEGFQASKFTDEEFSIALTAETDRELTGLFGKPYQEDLAFAYWKPSQGASRYTAVLQTLVLPEDEERVLQGNAAFTSEYLSRVLDERPHGAGIAFVHSHLGPGWQGMSFDDVVAERDRLASVVAAATGLPLVGLTWGTDGSWSGRTWLREEPWVYKRRWAETVRCVGRQLRTTFHPDLRPAPSVPEAQTATVSVWGRVAQQDLVRTHVGIIGLGSVGSIVAETLSRTGIQRLTLIDHDRLELRNLDRTLGAHKSDADGGVSKVESAKRLVEDSHTSDAFEVIAVDESVLSPNGLGHALDCDVLISCVDRPWPRHVLQVLGYSHLIPIIDGGILARVDERGHLLHVDWRIHTVGPGRACLYCLGALLRSDAALDREGMLDSPDYINGLSHAERERYGRRNVFAFSLSVASHQVLQLAGLVSGNPRVGGIGPQNYHAYPGRMDVAESTGCALDCDIAPLTASTLPPL